MLPALHPRNNDIEAQALRRRLDEVRPLLLTRRWFVVVFSFSILGMFTRVLPGSPELVTVLSLSALLLFLEKHLVERAPSARSLDRRLAFFAFANVAVSLGLLHISADVLWLPVLSFAVNLVAGGTALPRRSLVLVTVFSSLAFATYSALAITGEVHPGTLFGADPTTHDLLPSGRGFTGYVIGGVTVFLVAGLALPAFASLSYLMTSRLRATRDDLRKANADLDTALAEVVEARSALDRWNAQLNVEVREKTLALEEQNRFLIAINAISSAVNATMDEGESPYRLGQLMARLLDLDAVQFYAALEPDQRPLNLVVSASGDIAHAVAPIDGDVLRRVATTGEPVFEVPSRESEEGSAALAVAVVPLISKDRPLGALAAMGTRPAGWTEDERRVLLLLGREVGVAFENTRLYRSALIARARETALSNSLNALARDAERGRAVPQALELVVSELGGVFAAVVGPHDGRERRVLFRSAPQQDWVDYEDLEKAAVAAASLAADRDHPLVLGPRGEAPVSTLMLRRGIGSLILAPVVTTRLTERGTPSGDDDGRRLAHFEVVGTLVAMAPVGTIWGSPEADLLERLAAGIARRLESDALVEVQGLRIRELSGLARVVTTMQTTVEPDRLHQGFAQAMSGLVDYAGLYLVRLPESEGPPTLLRFASEGRPALAPPWHEGDGAHSWFELRHAVAWSSREDAPPAFLDAGAAFAIAAPMRARGQALGFAVVTLRSRPDAELVAVVGQAVEQLALALDSAMLYRQASDRAARIQVLGHLARIVASVVDLREAFGVFADEVRWLVSFDRASMLLVNEGARAFEAYATYPEAPDDIPPLPVTSALAQLVSDAEGPVAFSRDDPRWRDLDWAVFGADAQEVAAVRVVSGEATAAIFALARTQPHPFGPEEYAALEDVSGLLAVTIERLRLYAEAEYHARHDALTGLPNVRMLNEAMAQLDPFIEAGGEVALLLADMDELKSHNDTHGHQRGDEAIRMVARVLSANVRAEDLVVRMGGDEFVMVMRNADIATAEEVARRVHEGLDAARMELSWTPYSLDVSIGIAAAPQHGRDMRALLRAADRAMYDAKALGGGSTWIAGTEAPVVARVPRSRRRERAVEAVVKRAIAGANPAESQAIRLAQAATVAAVAARGVSAQDAGPLRLLSAAIAAGRIEAGCGLDHATLEVLCEGLKREWVESKPRFATEGVELASAAVDLAWLLAESGEAHPGDVRTALARITEAHPEFDESLIEAFCATVEKTRRRSRPRAA